ncbi:MAG: sigma-70 family RNA polymerase sigma factor [Bdellovibrionaceae bacterium]|nr:sigma-70 family RNA polymerase sigma factor [Pseudobdellovibrionaceae bacterium]MBX3034815.1 sigma-70 family RNA polymerase sigma factor [Pseudobdellovibrionaceae bacterium]
MVGRGLETKTDLELVGIVQGGDRRAFSELVKRHQRGLLRLSLRFMKDLSLAEDVVQESFIKAYEKLAGFEGRSAFKSWLYQIAVNTARNKIREFRRETTDIDKVHLAVDAVAETTLVHGSIADLLQKEVEKLPFRQRTALVLRVYEDLSFNEIAHIMECPYDTAKANYRHALMKLRETFEKRQELKSWTADVGGFWSEMNQYVEAEG